MDLDSAVSASRRAAAFARRTHGAALPADVVAAAKRHLLDALGVGFAAAAMRERPRVEIALRALGSGAEATGLGLAAPLPAPSAALLNGSLMHALEYDDTHMASVMHGSAVLAPVALALAERTGCSGRELLRGFVLGWELLARAGLAGPNVFQAQGFHGTPVAGAVAAALTASAIIGLDEDATVAAMGIAGSQASGIFEFLSNGSSVKMLHGGWPAFSGIMAAELARNGMTGPQTVFEGSRGLFASFARAPERGDALLRELGDLGERWLLPEAAMKPWPTCHYIQPALECAETLRARGLDARDVETVLVQVPAEVSWLVCEPWPEKLSPATGHVAKHSLPYCVAAMLLDGAVTPQTFDRPAPEPRLTAYARRITWQPLPDSGFPQRYGARLVVRTRGGEELHEYVASVRGSPERPFTEAQVAAKFRANAGLLLRPAALEACLAAVADLDASPNVASLSGALRQVG